MCKKPAYVGWGIMLVCTFIFIAMQTMPDGMQRQLTYMYGMVPIRYSNPQWAIAFGLPSDGYFSFISNLFLHASWLHILSNLWFIWIFANSIEDLMGHARFLIFYLLCGFVATFVQWYFDQDLAHPVVGASGAVAGILGAYFIRYPYARVVLWLPLFFLPIFFKVPAIAFLGFWVILQFQYATSTIIFDGATATVAWWAHLGGFISGVFLHPLFIRDISGE